MVYFEIEMHLDHMEDALSKGRRVTALDPKSALLRLIDVMDDAQWRRFSNLCEV